MWEKLSWVFNRKGKRTEDTEGEGATGDSLSAGVEETPPTTHVADAHEEYLAQMRRSRAEQPFLEMFGFRPLPHTEHLSTLVDGKIRTLAKMFSLACLIQEIARETQPDDSSRKVDACVTFSKNAFWDAHRFAKQAGYVVKDTYSEYLKEEAVTAS